MKKSGSVCQFNAERDAAIMQAYRWVMSERDIISIDEIAGRVVSRPCARFWVSEERAVSVVSAIMRDGELPQRMLPSKRRMFAEIHRRVVELRRHRPRASLYSLIYDVVNSPAPEFYMSPRYARDIIKKIIGRKNKSPSHKKC